MSDVYLPLTRTPEEWRAESRRNTTEEHASFERCDTDGFVSQWASNRMGALYAMVARIAEEDGYADFTALAEVPEDGAPIELRHVVPGAREVKTRYGWTWAIWNGDGSTTWFNPSRAQSAERRRQTDERKGYVEVTVRQQAVVVMAGDTMLSVGPRAIPARDSQPVEVRDDLYRDR